MISSFSKIQRLFQGARERIVIVSAFVGARALNELLTSVPDSVPRKTVFARWRMDDVASGATDWKAWDVARRHNAPLYACRDLHAKLYIADDRALVGSANSTAAGLGLAETANLELLIPADAQQPDVTQVLAEVEASSSLAQPLGVDAGENIDSNSAGALSELPIWLPGINPEAFLDSFRGQAPHTEETLAICKRLRLPEEGGTVATLRATLAETTSFRVIKHAFDSRHLLMTTGQLQSLLAEEIDSRIYDLSPDHVEILTRWLGHFGENTHFGRTHDGATPALHPGERLATFRIRSRTEKPTKG